MQKVERRWWVRLAWSGLLLVIMLFMSEGPLLLLHGVPTAYAAGEGSACTGSRHAPSFGGAVVVASNEVICSDITSFGGKVVIGGVVRGNVVSFGGNVIIAGKVDGNIYLYGGNVTLQDEAQVNGDIHLCDGQWVRGARSQLHGAVSGCSQSVGLFFLNGGGGFELHFWMLITWIGAGLLLITLLPEHVMLVRVTARSKTRRSFVLGLLSLLLAPLVLAVLIALIVALPLAIIVALGLGAAWLLGTVAIGWGLGDYLLKRMMPHYNTRLAQVIVGLTVLAVAESLPYIGWLVSIGVGMVGVGAVFLSRFGTRLYSQPRQPLTL
jgi:hypothetical protein